MIKNKIEKENLKLNIFVSISFDEFSKKIEQEIDNAMKKVKVPGFRPGKAPKNKLLERVNISEINNKVIFYFGNANYSKALNEALKIAKEQNLKLAGVKPVVDIDNSDKDQDKKEKKDIVLVYSFALLFNFDEVSLEKIKVEWTPVEFSKTDIETELKRITTKNEDVEKFEKGSKEKAKLDDIVNIDFKGFIGNEPFEGGEAEGYDLKLGSGSFIAGFEDQLVGKKAGDKIEVKVVFPSNYYVEDFKNKDAVFNVTINSISRAKNFELDDKFIQELKLNGITTVEDFKLFTKEKGMINKFDANINKFIDDVINEIINITNFDVSKEIVEYKLKELNKNFTDSLKSLGVKKHEYLNLIKSNEQKLQSELLVAAQTQSKTIIVQDYIYSKFKQNENKKDEFKNLEFKFSSINEKDKNTILEKKDLAINLAQQINKKLVQEIENDFKKLIK
ncbi:trigger factor [Mycoplasmopsis cricetuli]|uniref:trigger factor n=1 Tax=Mycoplasmopsis cricetuli TaxID=171283 RepID=UPI00046F7D00|nr:trigger factor [Mycoplasmopsis cricetuli]